MKNTDSTIKKDAKLSPESKKGFKLTFNIALFLIAVLFFVTIGLLNENFFKMSYILNVTLKNIVGLGLMALPMTMIIITGGIDLSNGSVMVLSTMISGLIGASLGGIPALIIGLFVGALLGAVNGVLIAKLNIAPMIVTLATMYLYRGIARGIMLGDSVYTFDVASTMGNSDILGIPTQIIIYAVVAVIFYLLLAKTTFGRIIFAIGLNENATKYSGINTAKVKIALYAIAGVVCSLAGLIYLGKFTTIKYIAGNASALQTIAIVILGGTDIMGGFGDIKGVVIATLIMAILNSGLTVLNISLDIQTIAHGLILMISLIVFFAIKQRALKNKGVSAR